MDSAISSKFMGSLLLLLLLLTTCTSLGGNVNVIKIGLVAPFEGRYRYIGYDAIYAARMAVREINAQGGAAGWRIDLVAYDDRASSEMARNAARNLIVDPDVVAVIGHYRAESTAAAQPLYEAAHIPLVVIGTWLTDTQDPPSSRLLWHLMPSPDLMARAMISTADIQPEGGTSAVVGEGVLASALHQGTGEVPTRYDPQQEKHTPHAGIVFSALPPHRAAESLAAWRGQGWQGVYICDFKCAAGEFTAIAGEALEGGLQGGLLGGLLGVQFVTPYPLPQAVPTAMQPTEFTQTLETWIPRYQAVGPHVAPPGIYALPTYEAVHLLAEALAHAIETQLPSANRTRVAAALPTIRRRGYLGTIAWDTDGFWAQAPLYVYRWTEGRPRLIKRIAE
jgi:branched-chain amino acid transport system substrate-binding protein